MLAEPLDPPAELLDPLGLLFGQDTLRGDSSRGARRKLSSAIRAALAEIALSAQAPRGRSHTPLPGKRLPFYPAANSPVQRGPPKHISLSSVVTR